MIKKLSLENLTLSNTLNESNIQHILSEYRFKDFKECYSSIQKLFKFYNEPKEFVSLLPRILKFVTTSGEADTNLYTLTQLIEKSNHKINILQFIINKAPQVVLNLFTFTYLTQLLFENSEWLIWLVEEGLGKSKSKELLLSELREIDQQNSPRHSASRKNDFKYLYQFKMRESFRIGVSEVMGRFNSTTAEAELSHLADACIQAVYEKEAGRFEQQYGSIPEGNYAIISLAQLGGEELSYKSPVSILFIYNGEGVSSGKLANLSAYDYYSRLSYNIIQIIQPKKEKPLYTLTYPKESERSSTPRVYTVEDYIRYLDNSDAIDNRFLLIKSRFSAGERALAIRFIKSIDPIIYKKYFSLTDISEVKHLIRGIFKKVTGMVDQSSIIEIMTQLFQLFHGSKYPEIQLQTTLRGIISLSKTKLITLEEEKSLIEGLDFFKKLEHKVELLGESELSSFLANHKLLNQLARSMGYDNYSDPQKHFQQDWQRISSKIQDILETRFQELVEKSEMTDFFSLSYQKPDDIEQFLSQFNFKNPSNAFHIIKELSPSSQKGRKLFAEILPILIKELKESADPDLLLVNLLKTVQSYKAKDSLFELLAHNKEIIHTLAKLFSTSQFLSEILSQYPELFEKMTDPDYFEYTNSIVTLRDYLSKILKIKPFTEAMFILKEYETFRIGLKNILGVVDFKETAYELSNLAEVILFESYKHFYKELSLKKGLPTSEIAIILLGKLGGKELNFGSDLDIFFVYEKENEISPGYTNSLFLNELIAKLSHFLSFPSPLGILYEIDLKLRPEGRNSPIVLSAKKLEDYLAKKGMVWEKLAYTKANILSTSYHFKKKIKQIITQFVYSPIDPLHLKKEVIDMRKKIVDNAIKKHGHQFLFKKGEGGLLDLEFMAQYLTISYGITNLKIRKKNLFNMIQSLHQAKIISKTDYETAYFSLIFLRKIETILRIMNHLSSEKLPECKADLEKLSLKLGFSDSNSFFLEFQEVTDKVRSLYNRLLS